MRKTLVLVVSTLLLLEQGTAEALAGLKPEVPSKRSFFYKMSVVLMTAATAVDAHSSWGQPEANPILRGPDGRFGYKAIAIKALVAGGVMGAQYMLLKNHPRTEKYGVVTNLALAGVLTGVAASNYRRQAGQRLQPGTPRVPIVR